MDPYHHPRFQKKTNEPIQRKLTDRGKDGRKDRRTDRRTNGQTPYFIGPFQPRPGVQQVLLSSHNLEHKAGKKDFLQMINQNTMQNQTKYDKS